MIRQHIGRLLSGGVIVLCVMFLCTPATHSQTIIATKMKFEISGSVGLPGVTMEGLPGAPMTDENGVYSAEVEYGWNGSIIPTKRGYTFEPKQRDYQKVTSNQAAQNYVGHVVKFTISGSTLPGVKLVGLPDDPISNESGRYTATVEYGWNGSVTPTLLGYRFNPPTKMYNEVIQNFANQNYQASEVTFTISGYVGGADGVVMKGFPGNVVTSGGGNYSAVVPYGWKGKVTPTKEGHEFNPKSVDYSTNYPDGVLSDVANENYTARVFTYQISGTTNMAGVTLKGFPEQPMSDGNGFYTTTVEHGWSGTVTPELTGYKFTPPTIKYPTVTSDYDSQDYSAEVIEWTISGNAGTSGVVMDGLPGNPTSDASGRYSAKVEYGWQGTVMPIKEGWEFDPPNQMYNPVVADRVNQTFKAKPITFQVSGNVGEPGVVLEGLPGRVVSGADGSYSAEVSYKWTGKVTPKKAGFEFQPPTMEYTEVIVPQMNQDYLQQIVQYTIAGQVRDETGPAAGVLIVADNNGGSATTDTEGKFALSVDHGWRGKVTPKSEKYTFNPVMRSLDPVTRDVSPVSFIGRIKMLTITNAVVFADEPFVGVKVTAVPGNYGAITNAKGEYTLRVPYGWSGELKFEKEGFQFPEGEKVYTNVTDNIDERPSAPAPAPPTPGPVGDTAPSRTTRTAPPVGPPIERRQADTVPGPDTSVVDRQLEVDPEKAAMQRRIDEMQRQIDQITGQPSTQRQTTDFTEELSTPTTEQRNVTQISVQPTLIDVLRQLSATTGVQIAIDATVKPVPVSLDFDATGMSVPAVLEKILEPIDYKYKSMGDNQYLVFRPISNLYTGQDLRAALQDVALLAGVTIVTDPNVTGEVYADLQDVPLETALGIMLSGTPFVVNVTEDRYLVADSYVNNPAFAEFSQTYSVFLNYVAPKTAVEHLPAVFAQYVRADSDPNGRIVTVTAPPTMAERIVTDLKRMDSRPRHVLLDARVVVMERTNLLDIGVEWGMPQISAGTFSTSFDTEGGGSWPWGVQIGYSSDQTFTDSLLMALNLLQKNSQAEIISNPQILAQDGKVAELGVITEEYYMLTPPETNNAAFYSTTEMVTIESGTKLRITPRIGDNNDITLVMATEVSDSVPAAAATELPVVTRRKATNVVTVSNGGTVALAGLTENRSSLEDREVPGFSKLPLIGGLFKNKNDEGRTREVAVFVTAYLVSETGQRPVESARQQPVQQGFGTQPQPQGFAAQPQPQAAATDDFQAGLRRGLQNNR